MSREVPILKLPKPSLVHMFWESRSLLELGMTNMLMPSPVITPAIYSRTDGEAGWHVCMNRRIDLASQAEVQS